jgi:hypothetical protein
MPDPAPTGTGCEPVAQATRRPTGDHSRTICVFARVCAPDRRITNPHYATGIEPWPCGSFVVGDTDAGRGAGSRAGRLTGCTLPPSGGLCMYIYASSAMKPHCVPVIAFVVESHGFLW